MFSKMAGPANILGNIKRRLKVKLGLTAVISISVIISIASGGIFLGVYSSWIIFEQKQRDTWAIMFLELERHADILSRKIHRFSVTEKKDQVDIYKIEEDRTLSVIRASTTAKITLDDFGLKGERLSAGYNILQLGGSETYAKIVGEKQAASFHQATLPPGRYLILWPLDFAKWMNHDHVKENKVYVLTREGKLIFSNHKDVTAANVVSRSLVQKFIKNPVTQGQFEFSDSDDRSMYGFVQEIPNTNVVIFSETPTAVAFAEIKRIIWRFAFVLLAVLIVSLLAIYLPINQIVETVRTLTRDATSVATGQFSGREIKTGIGELGILTSAFNQMRKSLVHRDQAIKKLMDEQKQKIRLEGEMEVAKGIQRNLLSDDDVPPEAQAKVATLYIPAEECAGDWYTYHYDEKHNELLMIIADVSGHGTGSSMFTAVIAGITEQAKSRGSRFDIDAYIRDQNKVLRSLGKGGWHATMLIARFNPAAKELELVNCGHSFPYIVYPEDSGKAGESVILKSMVLGIDQHCKSTRKVIPFTSGSQILMYTDGLEEAKGANGRKFGRKNIIKACNSATESPMQQVGVLQNAWGTHLGDMRPDDDVCLVSMRAL